MPATALAHFQQDIARARALIAHAEPLAQESPDEARLRSDLLRSAWMFAVGALDAYFCDAYTDVVAATIIAKSRYPSMTLPEFFYNIKVPIRAILETYTVNVNWRWRMAARKMMERETVLSLEAIQGLFNKFFRADQRFFGDLLLDHWTAHPQAKRRVFGITRTAYQALATADAQARFRQARKQLQERFRAIFQRRHDCIHNCDRPRVSPKKLEAGSIVLNVVEDVEFLVTRCDEHINAEFRHFLLTTGCPPAIVAQAGY